MLRMARPIILALLVGFAASTPVAPTCKDDDDTDASCVTDNTGEEDLLKVSLLQLQRGKQSNREHEKEDCNHPISVCNETRCTNPSFDVHASLNYGYLVDENPGAAAQLYKGTCDFVKYNVGSEGCGKLTDFTVATCAEDNGTGCPLYRVFDEPIGHKDPALTAWACGHSWSPPTSIEGKSLEKYFEDAGVCTHKYAACPAAGTEESTGNLGAYLLKCNVPYGHAFTMGPTQSTNCIAENGTSYTLPANDGLQIFWGNEYDDFKDNCEYCKIKQSEDGTYPDATACDESTKRIVELTPALCNGDVPAYARSPSSQ